MRVWLDDPLVQLNNPLGGTLRGREAIAGLYARIFAGPVKPWVQFEDIIAMTPGPRTTVFTGRERGAYGNLDLDIRTTRYFEYMPSAGGWRQVHHHGSIDNPELLRQYRDAVTAADPQLTTGMEPAIPASAPRAISGLPWRSPGRRARR